MNNGVQEKSGKTCMQIMMGKSRNSLANGKVISLSSICLDHLA